MSKNYKYILIGLGIIILVFLAWYFISIIVYIIIAAVLSLIGKPLADLLNKIQYKNIKIPRWISALITLIAIWIVFYSFFRIFIPVLANEANELSNINIQKVIKSIEEPIEKADKFIQQYQIGGSNNISIQDYITEKISSIISFSNVSSIFSEIAETLGNIFIALFSISFITFFLLKDDKLLINGILLFIPTKYEESTKKALSSIKKLLTRYFIGILIQITGIITLVTIGQTIVGVGFRHAIVIGLFAGFLNIIPYIGPILGTLVGLTLGLATHLHLEFYTELLPMLIYMLIVFLSVQTIDNVIFQPVIFSNSVNAHPLEIFIVILAAGSMAGILGMILAIPSYTVIRVIAKEFFNKYKFVKKLTEKI